MFYEESEPKEKLVAKLQETEKALKEYKEMAKVVTDQPIQGILIAQGNPPRIVFANNTIATILGRQVEEITRLVPEKMKDILYPDDRALFFQRYQERLEGKPVPNHYEFRALRPDGSIVWVEIYLSRIEFNGQPSIFVTLHDITDRKQSQDALKESDTRYRTLFEESRDAIFITSVDGRFIDFNQSMLDLFGYAREEMINMDVADCYHKPSDRKMFQATMEKNGSVRDYEAPLKKKDGTPMNCLLTSASWKDSKGAISGYQGIIRDISEQKKERQALQESMAQYRSTIESFSDAIHVIDKDFKLVMMNDSFKAWCRELGLPSEFDGRPVFELFPFLPDKVRDEYQHVIRTGEVLITEESSQIGNRTFYTETRKIPVLENEKVARVITVVRDITEKHRAHEDFLESCAKMRRILEETTYTLASTVEKRDPYTAGHQKRVAHLAQAIAVELGLTADEIEGIKMASLIHDIGKIYVPAEILNKPGRLTEIEYNLIKAHPQLSFDILKTIEFPWPVARAILQHHERIDGSGYPLGLAAADIIREAKILMVADVVEAIFSNRPYRPARGIDKALEEISRNRNVLYDPQVVDACLDLFNKKDFKFE